MRRLCVSPAEEHERARACRVSFVVGSVRVASRALSVVAVSLGAAVVGAECVLQCIESVSTFKPSTRRDRVTLPTRDGALPHRPCRRASLQCVYVFEARQVPSCRSVKLHVLTLLGAVSRIPSYRRSVGTVNNHSSACGVGGELGGEQVRNDPTRVVDKYLRRRGVFELLDPDLVVEAMVCNKTDEGIMLQIQLVKLTLMCSTRS